MSIDIPPQYLPFVQQAVASGRFESESALVGEALRLLQQRHDQLKQAVQRGFDQIDRGESFEIDDDDQLHRFFEDIMREARAEIESREKV
jgi:putative addiction module CopG family antidote